MGNSRNILAAIAGLALIVVGCTNQNAATPSASDKITAPTLTPVAPPTEAEKARKFLDTYLGQIVKGDNSTYMFCDPAVASSFFAPRKYEVLTFLTAEGEDGFSAKVRIESSNQGGMSITKDWTIVGKRKEQSVTTQIAGVSIAPELCIIGML
jgi:hypothetical protein